MSKSTINDIAIKLGVSKTLVSFVLNGKSKEHRISEDMQERVFALARELEYKPNPFARGLRTGKTASIGLIVSDIANPLFAKLCRYIENEAQQHHYNVIIASSDEKQERLLSSIETLIDKKTDGIIIVPTEHCEHSIALLNKNKIPFVCIDRSVEALHCSSVTSNNYESSLKATNEMMRQGKKRIAYVGLSNQLSNFKQRFQGYRDALTENKIEIDNAIILQLPFHCIEQEMKSNLDNLLMHRPEAIFFANNTLALEGLKYIHKRGRSVVDKIDIYCFDNDPAFTFYEGNIFVITQSFEKMAHEAMTILLSTMSEQDVEKKHIEIETEYFL